MSEKCELHAAIEGDVKRHESDIKEIKDDIININLKHVEFNTKYVAFMEMMSPLPKILEGIKQIINDSQNEIKLIQSDISELKDNQEKKDEAFKQVIQTMKQVEDKGKVDLVSLGTNNIGKIVKWVISVAALIGAFLAGKSLF